jgi:hypothetical protein
MAANIDPIFTVTPKLTTSEIPTAYALLQSNGVTTIGTNSVLAFSAGANGSYVQRLRLMPKSMTTAAVTTAATSFRVFLSTVASGATTAANTNLLAECTLPAVSSGNATIGNGGYDLPLNIAMPSGTYLLIAQGTVQTTNSNWGCTAIGGDY